MHFFTDASEIRGYDYEHCSHCNGIHHKLHSKCTAIHTHNDVYCEECCTCEQCDIQHHAKYGFVCLNCYGYIQKLYGNV